MLKSFFPTICPACGSPLVIEQGDKEATLKLMCNNKECEGSLLKRLQKGITALEIKGLGPAVIESLMNSGINSSLDLFNPSKFNEKTLIASGQFKKGRSLEKIIDAVKNTKSLPIHKVILSLQLDNVGKTVSEKIGLLISGMDADFAGLPYAVRDNMDEIKKEISDTLDMFESFGVEIIKNKPKVFLETEVKKISKYVAIEDDAEIKEVVEKLGWCIVSVEDEKCQMFICIDKSKHSGVEVKVMTLKQIKLLFA